MSASYREPFSVMKTTNISLQGPHARPKELSGAADPLRQAKKPIQQVLRIRNPASPQLPHTSDEAPSNVSKPQLLQL